MKLILKNALFTVIVPGTVGVYAPLLLAQGLSPSSGLALLLSLPLFAISLSVYLWSVWNFASRGKGTPSPLDAPKHLVVQGPYLYTRNPMYVALFSALLGWLLVYQTLSILVYLVAFLLLASAFVILYEEPRLSREFGIQYEHYKARVPRWLPRLSRPPDA